MSDVLEELDKRIEKLNRLNRTITSEVVVDTSKIVAEVERRMKKSLNGMTTEARGLR